MKTERSTPIDNIGYLSDFNKHKRLRDEFIIPDILKIALVDHRKTGFWQINVIPYNDYINLGIHIIHEATGLLPVDIPCLFLFNLLYWTEYIFCKGAAGELFSNSLSSMYFNIEKSEHVTPQEIEAVGMQGKLSSIIWTSPRSGIYIPSNYAVDHVLLAGQTVKDETKPTLEPLRDVIVNELFYDKEQRDLFYDYATFISQGKLEYYLDVLPFLSKIFSALVLMYESCKEESVLYSEIIRKINPIYKESETDYKKIIPRYIHSEAETRPLLTFETQYRRQDTRKTQFLYPYGDFASAQATCTSRAQYSKILDIPCYYLEPDKKLWVAVIQSEMGSPAVSDILSWERNTKNESGGYKNRVDNYVYDVPDDIIISEDIFDTEDVFSDTAVFEDIDDFEQLNPFDEETGLLEEPFSTEEETFSFENIEFSADDIFEATGEKKRNKAEELIDGAFN